MENGPWAINNTLLVLDRWHAGMNLRNLQVASLPVWVQFWGLNLDYQIVMTANMLSNAVETNP